MPAGSANFTEMQIKTGRFMFFITQLTENTNLAVALPPSEQMFNAARINIQLLRYKFEELDVGVKRYPFATPGAGAGVAQAAARPVAEAGGVGGREEDEESGEEESERDSGSELYA